MRRFALPRGSGPNPRSKAEGLSMERQFVLENTSRSRRTTSTRTSRFMGPMHSRKADEALQEAPPPPALPPAWGGGEGGRRRGEGELERFMVPMHAEKRKRALQEPARPSNRSLPWESGAEDARTPNAGASSADSAASPKRLECVRFIGAFRPARDGQQMHAPVSITPLHDKRTLPCRSLRPRLR